MNGNVCRDVRQEIDQSELRESLSAGSEAHVGACPACATFRDERLRLRELEEDSSRVSPNISLTSMELI